MKTTIARDIDIAGNKARLDEAANNIIENKYVIAHIMRECLSEYKGISVKTIISKYITEAPAVQKVRIEPDVPEDPGKMQGLSTDDKSPVEGNLYYDIRFSALIPDTEEKLRLIVVIENQGSFYPGYPLLKRGGYYCGRLISAQKGTVFTGDHYEKLQKVYVIFICFNPPKYQENSITRYSMQEENIVGAVKNKQRDVPIQSPLRKQEQEPIQGILTALI